MKTVAELLKLKDSHRGEVHTIAPEQMVIDVIKLMAAQNIGAVPVVKDGQVVGIVSERDYVRKMELKGRASVGTPVSEIMTPDVMTVDSQHTVDQCMKIMTDRRLRHLPVVDHGELVGLLSIGDLVKEAIDQQARVIEKMQQYIRGESY